MLSTQGMAMLATAIAFFGLLVWNRLPIGTVCLGLLTVLPLGFLAWPVQTAAGETVDPMRFFNGFGHPALIAICSLMVMGHALVLTGALEPVARRLAAWVAAAPRLAPLAVMAGAAGASGLVNDTPVVVLLIPLIIAATQRAKTAAGTLLLPMNYAVLIGGMATTIGTSTNLIVVALAVGLGVKPFGIFDFYPLVAMAAVPALAYLWLAAPLLLRHVQPPTEMLSAEVFDAEFIVEADSWLDGRELKEVLKTAGDGLPMLQIRRGERTLMRLPTLKLRPGDRLLVQDTAANLKNAAASLDAKLHGVEFDPPPPEAEDDGDEPRAPLPSIVAQMIVTAASPLVGRTVSQMRISERYGVAVVGLRARNSSSEWQGRGPREKPIDRMVAIGDILLLQGAEKQMQQAQHDGIGLLLDAQLSLPRQHKSLLALGVMAAVVLLAATKLLPISIAALGGVLVLLLARGLSWQEVTQSLSAKVVLLVASSLALGEALELTGVTAWMAGQLAAHTTGLSAAWVLALLMALMGLLTNFVSNNAAAAIGTPLAVELARSLGVAPEPFVLAVLFGCNLCYLTPMGYQTNLLVMSAAGYKFGDFARVGAPLFLIMWAVLSWGLVRRYGL